MPPPVPPPQRLIVAAVLLAAFVAVTLAVLVVRHGLAPSLAILVALATLGTVALVVRLYRQDVAAVARYVQDVAAADRPVPVPDAASGAARAVMVAVARLHRTWLRRLDRLAGRLDANESILEALPDPLILVDHGRRVVRANAAARALFGERMPDGDLAAVLRAPMVLDAVDAVLGGGASRSLEYTRPVPVERVFEVRVKPFRYAPPAPPGENASGEPAEARAVLLSFHDVTAGRRLEQMRADFIANASHELRTPLSSLLGFLETLRGPARDDADARERFLAIMHEQAGRMARLVDDLLSLSRIEVDEHMPPTGRVKVLPCVTGVVAALELKARARGITLRVDAPEPLPPVVGDEDQLTQVFQNLISNAVKYTRPNTEVTVAVTRTDGTALGGRGGGPMVAVAVTDRGEGIERTHLPRLTERFYRVDPARSRALGGTGLGLAIVKHIVNRHRGRLTIDSEVGRGSTFTVYLPATAGEAGAGETDAGRTAA